MWQHVKLSEQIRPWDTLTCCWDVKQPTKKQTVELLQGLGQNRREQFGLGLQNRTDQTGLGLQGCTKVEGETGQIKLVWISYGVINVEQVITGVGLLFDGR